MTDAPLSAFRDALRAAGFSGDVEVEWGGRVAASTDNSIYQIVPDAVVAPRDREDLKRLLGVMNQEAFKSLSITGRGGSTGTNGQGLNGGVIVEFRRYMNRILAVDEGAQWAEVEPGVVLDQLNALLKGREVFFSPDTSTASRCTIGGMVSTDACGQGSRVYGKTGDNVLELDVLLADGTEVRLRRLEGEEAIGALTAANDPGARVLAEAMAACDEGAGPLEARIPGLRRHFVGYDLVHARPSQEIFDPVRLVVGSEGTLALVTAARVKLTPKPVHKRLVVVSYKDFDAALASAKALLAHEPTAIETLDDTVHTLAYRQGLLDDLPERLRTPDEQGRVPVSNYLEFTNEDPDALVAAVDGLIAALATEPTVVGWHVAEDPAEILRIWGIRKSSVGLLGGAEGTRRPVPFVEDCVVPPENLRAFVAEFRALLNAEKLTYGMFGHVDVGCIHVRPALDISTAEDRERMKRISDAVFALVRKHGGIFWGEHGKGVRGQYLPDMVGPEAYSAFAKVKRAFDPGNRLNPGKLVNPDADVSALLKVDQTPFRLSNSPEQGLEDPFADAFRCNGNAQCQAYSASIPMCPSYKATGERRHSPKGRADLLRAWHRLRAESDAAAAAVADEVYAALDGCLGCKACATTCPIHVDVPEMKSLFLEHYHATRPRTAGDRMLGSLEWLSMIGAGAPGLVNLGLLVGRPLAERIGGIVDAPAFSSPSLSARLRARDLRARSAETAEVEGPQTVFVIQDSFTTPFDAAAVTAVIDGLKVLGYRPQPISLFPTGKALHVKGYRAQFRKVAAAAKATLDALPPGVPRVGVDPSAVLLFRQEYAKAGLAPAEPVLLPQEFLSREAAGATGAGWPRVPDGARPVVVRLMLHCTERTAVPQSARQWKAVFAACGLTLDVPDAGCCGMAGAFGHEARNQEVSKKLYDMSWRTPVAEAGGPVAATGYSCRSQMKRCGDEPAGHPLALLAQWLGK